VCPDATGWANVLLLCKLIFSLPFSNSWVEQIFSSLKYLKSTKRNSLQISDVLEIHIEGPKLDEFSANSAIDLWLSECTRRPQQNARKQYKSREQTAGSSSNVDVESDKQDNHTFTLDEWDQWLCSSDDSVSEDET